MADVEDRLRRYRPVGPPTALRADVVAGAARGRRGLVGGHVLAWVPACAAVLVAALFYWMAASLHVQVVEQVTAGDRAARQAVVTDLTEAFGGGAAAAFEAERIVAREEMATMIEDEQSVQAILGEGSGSWPIVP